MSALTYSLVPRSHPEKSYYNSVEELATEVLVRAGNVFRPVLDFIAITSPEQACLDLLLLGIYARRGLPKNEQPRLEHLDNVLGQLQQSRDYTYQVGRLRIVQRMIMAQPIAIRSVIWHLINRATYCFAKRSSEVLGAYTAQVTSFLASFNSSHRSDALFCTSPVLEYHANMVGAEILNRLWQKSFAATEQKLLVLPGCLRASTDSCTAVQWTLGFKCHHCNQGCQINELSKLGDHYGFQVCFVEHQSSLVSHVQGLSAFEEHGSLGILGVACVLSLLEGGFMLEAHNVPAQCVALDYCGCTNHWHKDGFATRVNVERVLDLMIGSDWARKITTGGLS